MSGPPKWNCNSKVMEKWVLRKLDELDQREAEGPVEADAIIDALARVAELRGLDELRLRIEIAKEAIDGGDREPLLAILRELGLEKHVNVKKAGKGRPRRVSAEEREEWEDPALATEPFRALGRAEAASLSPLKEAVRDVGRIREIWAEHYSEKERFSEGRAVEIAAARWQVDGDAVAAEINKQGVAKSKAKRKRAERPG